MDKDDRYNDAAATPLDNDIGILLSVLHNFEEAVGETIDDTECVVAQIERDHKARAAGDTAPTSDIRWAVNVLLEKIAAKFEANDTMDIWRSDAAATVRSFKHDLSSDAAQPSPVSSDQMAVEIELFYGLTSFMHDQ